MSNSHSLPSTICRPLIIGSATLIGFLGLFFLWAILAPLASTIHTSGTLISETPSYDVQHEFGGKISKIYVRQHDLVRKGDPLIEFNTTNLAKTLSQSRKLITALESENIAMNAILTPEMPEEMLANSTATKTDKVRFSLILKAHQLDKRSLADKQQTALAMEKLFFKKISHQSKRVSSVIDRVKRGEALLKKGALTQKELDDAREELQSLLAARAEDEARRIQNSQEAAALRREIDSSELNFRTTLFDAISANERELVNLTKEALQLSTQIEASKITAPIDGSVISLDFDTPEMIAARGVTLMQLGDELSNPRVSIVIPTHSIDQVALYQSGKLTVPALPQRNLPNVRAKIISISPDVKKDADGIALGYPALAEINPSDLKALAASLSGDLLLATGMPISLALEGREITFAQYLITPFLRAFDGALIE